MKRNVKLTGTGTYLAPPEEVLNAEVATKHDIKELELKIDTRFEKIQGEFTLVKWMIGFNLAMSVSILFKIFS